MPHPLYIAFIWHQHQPLYKCRDGKYRMPWVRLHGTKDYLDLILLLEKYPKLHQTVNLVPSLIEQLEDYVAGTAFDPYLELALMPFEQLKNQQRQFIIRHFFDGNHHTLIDPHPRYRDLFNQRQEHGESWCLDNWQERDYGDLLAWHNLSWFDPLFWEDPDIAGWLAQDHDFTLSDRQRIYSKQREIIAQIIPKHREMQESGQLEITTTPYSHPILPLLANTDVGRVAIPNMDLPQKRFAWAEDIPRHLDKAWNMYKDRFGRTPQGLWPSEQAVSPAILPYIAQQGFKWLCSDESVLGHSIKHFFHRDHYGHIQEPELLYQPYKLATEHGDLAMVFRDHRLSDLIGFTYSAMEPEQSTADLIGHLTAIRTSLVAKETADQKSESVQKKESEDSLDKPWLVTIALDGENCWEHYHLDGKPFLEQLYQKFSDDERFKLVTVNEFVSQFPPTAEIPSQNLHTGSWVDGSLTTWIGDPAKNRAWDMLTMARQVLANHPEATPENNPEAWEALYAAEGSDWFWWFGEGHSSNNDAMFDQLFREHLVALYQALNEQVPSELTQYIEDHHRRTEQRPEGFIHPVIDGQGDEQDWNFAGRLEIGGARGTMHQSSTTQRIYYGVDHRHFYTRLDFKQGTKPGVDIPSELNLVWFYSNQTMHNSLLPLAEMPHEAPMNYRFHHRLQINLLEMSCWFQEAIDYDQWEHRPSAARVAWDKCLEIAVPWEDLNIEPDYALQMMMFFADHGRYRSYLPENEMISLQMP